MFARKYEHVLVLIFLLSNISVAFANSDKQTLRRKRSQGTDESLTEYNAKIGENAPGRQIDILQLTGLQNRGISYKFNVLEFDPFDVLTIRNGFIEIDSNNLNRENSDIHRIKFQIIESVTGKVEDEVRYVLTVSDVNDEAPNFLNSQPLRATLASDAKRGQEIITLTVTDEDNTPDSERRYTLEFKDTSTIFSFENSGPQIVIAGKKVAEVVVKYDGQINLITGQTYDNTIELIDSASNRREVLLTVFIGVAGPRIQTFPDPLRVPEEASLNHRIYKVEVDHGSTNLFFEIPEDPSGLFSINSLSGELFVKEIIDADVSGVNLIYRIKIQVTEVDSSKEDSQTMNIEFVDVNDNKPSFSVKSYSETVYEDFSVRFKNTEIIQVSAKDADLTNPNKNIYYAIRGQFPFRIDPVTGSVYAEDSLDYDNGNPSVYYIPIYAIDKGIPPNEEQIILKVTVTNVNDEPPVFKNVNPVTGQYEFQVNKDSDIGAFVGSIRAVDPDGSSTITYSLIQEPQNSPLELESGSFAVTKAITDDEYMFVVKASESNKILEASSRGSTSSTVNVHVSIKGNNMNQPVFLNCDNSKISVDLSESANPNTDIVKLRVTDSDFGVNGEVDFRIFESSNAELFQIERSTNGEETIGTLKSLNNFDRETIDRYEVTVIAEDGFGADRNDPTTRFLQSICQVIITITDVADTIPKFLASSYKGEVSKLAGINTKIIQVIAIDRDTTKNVITYAISSTDPTITDYFEITSEGFIQLKGQIHNLEEGVVAIDVKASDESGAEASVGVQITIIDEDITETVTFVDGPYTFDIDEIQERTEIPNTLMKISTTGSLQTTCNLLQGETPNTNSDNTFTLEMSSTSNDVSLKLNDNLDYETINQYFLTLMCQDSNFRDYYTQITVNIQDKNDEAPIFKILSNVINIYANSPLDFIVSKVEATDRDVVDTVSYEISENEFFKINSATGEILVKKIDIPVANYIVSVTASDNRQSDITSEVNIAVQKIIIKVLDFNDNPPKLIDNDSPYTISEGTKDFNIDNFGYTDEDDDPGQVFTFRVSTPSVPFYFDKSVLYITKEALDYDSGPKQYEFEIVVNDGLFDSEPQTVVVKLTNVDDQPPVFYPSDRYTTEVEENSNQELPYKILTLNATNNDAVDGNNAIQYSLAGDTNKFLLKDNELFCNSVFDREDIAIYSLSVIATDASELQSFATVSVTIKDVNDNAPTFDDNLRILVVENSPYNTNLARIIATDLDDAEGEHLYGKIVSYTITGGSGSDVFKVDNQGNLQLKAAGIDLDRETQDLYTLDVEAEDGGGKKGKATLTVVITDEDDNQPTIIEPVDPTVEIFENDNINSPIYSFSVNDPDTPPMNAKYTADITENSAAQQHFSASFNALYNIIWITLKEEITYADGSFSLTVAINNEGYTDTASVEFKIRDINNEKPIIDGPDTIDLLESVPVGIISKYIFTVSDADTTNNQNGFTWRINSDRDARLRFGLSVDSSTTTARLTIARPLDYELKESYSLQLLVTDEPASKEEIQLTGTHQVTVNVQNVDDEAPVLNKYYDNFPLGNLMLEIQESDSPPIVPVFTFKTKDFDEMALENQRMQLEFCSWADKLFTFQENSMQIVPTGAAIDREAHPEPCPLTVTICDSADNCGEQIVQLYIGDRDDMPQGSNGLTQIDIFLPPGINTTETQIRTLRPIYVNDKDCCDQSKVYRAVVNDPSTWIIDENSGVLTINAGLRVGTYSYEVQVTDQSNVANSVGTVTSNVDVNVQNIAKGVIENYMITAKIVGINANQFIDTILGGASIYTRFKNSVLKVLDIANGNSEVSIFAMSFTADNPTIYGLPYEPSTVTLGFYVKDANGNYVNSQLASAKLSKSRVDISNDLGDNVELAEVIIDSCRNRDANCWTQVSVEGVAVVASGLQYTWVGLQLTFTPKFENYYEATAPTVTGYISKAKACENHACKNGGTCEAYISSVEELYSYKCNCIPGFDGFFCEKVGRSFEGTSYALFKPFVFYQEFQVLSFEFATLSPNGTLFYAGPMDEVYSPSYIDFNGEILDFLAVELVNGAIRVSVNLGSITHHIQYSNLNLPKLNDGKFYRVIVTIDGHLVSLLIPSLCHYLTDGDLAYARDGYSQCEVLEVVEGDRLTVPFGVQIGGMFSNQFTYQELYNLKFTGCIRNVRNNGFLLDMSDSFMTSNSPLSCPSVDLHCGYKGIRAKCGNKGSCDATFNSFQKCDCAPGTQGPECKSQQNPVTMSDQSIFIVDPPARKRRSATNVNANSFQITMRTTMREREMILVELRGINRMNFMRLSISSGRPQFVSSFNNIYEIVVMNDVDLSDGQWHTISVSRIVDIIELKVVPANIKEQVMKRGGQNFETFEPGVIFVGGYGSYDIRTATFQVDSNFEGCIAQFIYDGEQLPLKSSGANSPAINRASEGCNPTPCAGVALACPAPQTLCTTFFDKAICNCPVGSNYITSTNICNNINECAVSTPCKNGAGCFDIDVIGTPNKGLYRCDCGDGYSGDDCGVIISGSLVGQASLSMLALLIFLLCLLFFVVVFIIFVTMKVRRVQATKEQPYEDQKLSPEFYEGAGECDQKYYNIAPLRKPLDDTFYTPEGPHKIPIDDHLMKSEYPTSRDDVHEPQMLQSAPPPAYYQNKGFEPDDYYPNQDYAPDIPEFLNNRLKDADKETLGRGHDLLMVYHLEGEGSDAGTISTINTNREPDFDQFRNWGGKFDKLSNMFSNGN